MGPAGVSSEDGASEAGVKTKGHDSSVRSVRVLCDLGLATFPARPHFLSSVRCGGCKNSWKQVAGLWDDSLSEVGKPRGPQTGG